MSVRVMLVDDHRIMRDGLRSLLQSENDIEVVGEAADGREAVTVAGEVAPDVVVMDLTMPGMSGTEATAEILAARPDTKVLALSMVLDRGCVVEALKAGGVGYILKECAAEELVTAIRAVASGSPYLCDQITSLIMKDFSRNEDEKGVDTASRLSKREREVLQQVAEGRSTKAIAFEFGVSIKTVEVQRHNIMKKLNLFSVAELTKFAIREGLTSID